LDGVLPVGDALDDLAQAVRVGLGEEAHVTEVDADERDVTAADPLGGAQQRAVAAQHQDELGVLRRVVPALVERLDAQRVQPLGHLGCGGGGLRASLVPVDEDAPGHGTTAGRWSTAAAITASSSSGWRALSDSRRKP